MHKHKTDAFYKAAKAASLEVYTLLRSPRLREDFDPLDVGEGGDICVRIDLKAETIYFSHFLPHFALYSEESGHAGEGDYCIILDPIDGSDNFVSRFPYYGASMALQYKGETIAGFVVNFGNGDIFYRDFQSVLVRTSLLDDTKVKVVKNPHTKVGIFEKSALYPKKIDSLIKNRLKFRSPGAVALSLAYAHDARYVIFLGTKRSFDLEAGLFLVQSLSVYEDETTIIIAHDGQMLEKLKQILVEDN